MADEKKINNTEKKMTMEQKIKYMRDKEREKVRGRFIFHECPGGKLKFMFKKYQGDHLEKYELQDGEIYTVPLGVARHLNTNCWYPEHRYLTDEEGKRVARVGRKVPRCSFQSLEFIEDPALAPRQNDILMVEKA